ncbi:MAG: hypothetical protein JNM63_16535 [Spirochaetia bacterium]|nr:hypothetical protein [Spirochaetia bacterium]
MLKHLFVASLLAAGLFAGTNDRAIPVILKFGGEGTNIASVKILVSNQALAQYLKIGKIQVDLDSMTRREYGLRGKLLMEDSNFAAVLKSPELPQVGRDPDHLFFLMGLYYAETKTPFVLNKKSESEKMAEFQKKAAASGLGPEYDLLLYRSIGDKHSRQSPGFHFELPRDRFKESEASFESYLINFPNGPLAGESLFRIAICQWKQKNESRFRETLAAYVDFMLEKNQVSAASMSVEIQNDLAAIFSKKDAEDLRCQWQFGASKTAVRFEPSSREIKIQVSGK